jgi:hypothetical protein
MPIFRKRKTTKNAEVAVAPQAQQPATILVSAEQRGTLEVGDEYEGRKIIRIDEMAGSYQLTLE